MHHLLLSSTDRVDGTTSDNFVIEFVSALEGKFLVKYSLIPNTLYNVNTKNNVIPYTDAAPRVAVLPAGSYSGATLALAIKQRMDAASAPITYTVVYDTATGKLTLTPSVGTISFQWGTYGGGNSAAKVLGFENKDVPAAPVLTSPNLVSLSYPPSLGILIQEVATFNVETASSTFLHIYIPFDAAFGYYKTLGADVLPQILRFTQRTKRLTVRVVDMQGLPVSLNNADFEILLQKL